jgi:hypothetical protein
VQVANVPLLLAAAQPVHLLQHSQVVVRSARNEVLVDYLARVTTVLFVSDYGDALVPPGLSHRNRHLLLGGV